jgi:hypothetical protein
MKIEAVIGAITDAQHKLAVYDEVINFLSDCYLSSDTDDGDEGPETLTVNEPCLVPEVPQTVIDIVIEEIVSLRDKDCAELTRLRSLEIATNAGRSKKPRGKRKPSGN